MGTLITPIFFDYFITIKGVILLTSPNVPRGTLFFWEMETTPKLKRVPRGTLLTQLRN